MKKIPVTVLVQTKNEELGISRCLIALKVFDEVVVVDSNSTDCTKQIAVDHGARVENFTWNGKYPKKKQWQLDNLPTRHPWVLFIDADETPTAELLREIESLNLAAGHHAAFDISLDYVFAGRVLKHGHTVEKRALVHRDRVKFPVIDDLDIPGMGELEGHYQPAPVNDTATVGRLKGRILHNDQDPIRTWFERHNKYSDWEANLRARPNTRRNVAATRSAQGRLFEKTPLKPLVFFIYSYLIKKGFLDGRAGFDYAFALATYYWQISLKVREIRRYNLEVRE